MPKYDFIAIDVETAALSKPRFICQIGLAYVIGDQIVRTESFLVRPPHNRIHPRTSQIHGIYESDTENELAFPEIWEQIEEELKTHQLVAHNASFDSSVLAENLSFYTMPNFLKPFVCTYRLLKRGLKDLCYGYAIDYTKHHDACFDAKCCAQFYINYLNGVLPDTTKMSVKLNNRKNTKRYNQ
ncbi:MAG: exonuclease domain-containing protein [Bacteroides sp.]